MARRAPARWLQWSLALGLAAGVGLAPSPGAWAQSASTSLTIDPTSVNEDAGRVTITLTLNMRAVDRTPRWASLWARTKNRSGADVASSNDFSGGGTSGDNQFTMIRASCGTDSDGNHYWDSYQCRQTLSFDINDDMLDEDDENLEIVFGLYPTDGTTRYISAQYIADLTILDNDDEPNAKPTVTTTALSHNENEEFTSQLKGADEDDSDTVGVWRFEDGGTDNDKFNSFIQSDGRLQFKAAPDFENPADDGGNNAYEIKVAVSSGTGTRHRWSAPADVTVTVANVDEPPAAVTNIRRTAGDNDSLDMAWTAPAADATRPPVTGYEVAWKWNGVDVWPTGTATATGNPRSVTAASLDIDGLVAGSRYDIRVRAVNNEGAGAWTERKHADQTTTGTAPAGGVTVSKTSVNPDEGGTETFTVVLGTKPRADVTVSPSATAGATVAPAKLTFTESNWSTAQTVTVTGSHDADADDDSATVTLAIDSDDDRFDDLTDPTVAVTVDDDDTKLATPQNLALTAGDTQIDASWDQVMSAAGYRVEWNCDGTTGSHDVSSGTVTDYTIGGLTNGTECSVTVRATGSGAADGMGNADSDRSAAETATPQETGNSPPTVTTTALTVNENVTQVPVAVAATDPENDPIAGFALSGTGADNDKFTIDSDGVLRFKAMPDFEAMGSAAGDNDYKITVTATSGSGGTLRTSAAQAITVTVNDVAEPPGKPAAPMISGQTDNSFKVIWTAPDNTGRPAIERYDVEYREDTQGASWQDAMNEPVSGTLEVVISGLNAATAYKVRVRAANDEGDGPYSDEAAASTTTPQLATPTGLSLTAGDGQIEVSWSAVTNAASYRVEWDCGGTTGFATPTASSYTIPSLANGVQCSVKVRATAGPGFANSAFTAAMTATPQADPNKPATGLPTISDTTPLVGQTLTAGTSGIDDADGLGTFSYRWIQTDSGTDSEISGATSSTYTVQTDDRGKTLKVRVSFTDGRGHLESVTSAATSAVKEKLATPGSFTATAGDTQVSLAWTVVPNATGYTITRHAPAPEATQTVSDGSTTSYDWVGLTNGETYTFSIVATGPADFVDSAASNQQPATPQFAGAAAATISLTSPTALTEANIGGASLTVDLTNATYAASGTLSSSHFSLVTTPPTAGLGVQQIQRNSNTQVTVRVSAMNFNIAADIQLAVRIAATGHSRDAAVDSSAVTVATVNTAPVFSSGATRTFTRPENQTEVGTVSATDSDPEDSVAYALSGTDAGLFSITSGGVITFNAAPNYEAPQGGQANNSNAYTFTVTATGGTDARAMTATQDITVNVTNVENERPGKPDAPTFGTTTVNSIPVNWQAPDNEGPSILHYDLRYQRADTTSPGSWTNGPQDVAASPAMIAGPGLAAGTQYRVQVRATNADGDGPWSDSGTATTEANAEPSFTSSATFTAAENQTAVGTVTATDADNQDTIQSYALSGPDMGKLSITSPGGVLTFDAAPDFEAMGSAAGDNAYKVTVTVTSGTGDRALTATQDVTVNVTDVDGEVPGKPAAPSFTAADITPLVLPVTWTPPANAGPDIQTYDLQYRIFGTTVAWMMLTGQTGLSANISGLTQGTTYDVQVRAVNADGKGPWSDSATATTSGNAAPVISSSATFTVDENVRTVGDVEAADADSGDEIESYDLSGTDEDDFEIGTDGALSFKADPDFERPTGGTAGNSAIYTVTVTVTSGTGDRAETAMQEITVTVRNVNEPPGKPAAPTAGTTTVNSAEVSWTAPANTGPVIQHYDLRYYAGSADPSNEADWTDGPQDEAGLSATIGSLSQNTTYRVQVLATNAEGDSDWSESGTVMTAVNAAPTFSSGATFSVEENETEVGTVVATDTDSQDSIQSYVLSGADMDKLSITRTGGVGVLTFDAAPDFEAMASAAGDNAYKVTVTVTSGTSAREATAAQHITVNVTDDDTEEPDVPAPPSVSVLDFESLSVSWDEPDNIGPDINDYDVRYQPTDSDPNVDAQWSELPDVTDSTATAATIPGLMAGTTYRVQVRAQNEEGTSGWSASSAAVATHHNRPPAFSGTQTAFNVPENTTTVATVTATDPDPQETSVAYTLEGVDASHFQITGSGTLSFTGGKNFEGPDDTDTDGVYEVTVRATTGTGAREMSSIRAITVTLTNVGGEAPGAPAAPTVDMATVNSLRATWAAPGTNTGPDITDYDVRYQPTDNDPNVDAQWSELPDTTDSTATAATIPGLMAGTTYRVQVRAQNGEGAGNWSPSAIGETDANRPPTFSSAASFTVDENTPVVTAVVTVTASDPDNADFGDAITGYTLSGDDHTKFSITSPGGVLTFKAVPDFEAPVDVGANNVYEITVTATSGTGDRTLSAEQPIAVTVANLDETPTGKPTIDDTTPQVGQTLTADGSGISDPDTPAGPTFSYQWNRITSGSAMPITGATEGTYTVQEADGGLTLSVTARWTDGFGANEMLTSDPTGTVATKPGAPGSVSAGSFTATGFTISWSAPDSDGGRMVTDYEYRFGTTGAWTSTGSTATTHSFNLSRLAAGRDTQFQLRAVNAVGEGDPAIIVLNRQMQVNTPTVALSLDTNSIDESGSDNSATLTVTLDGTATTADTGFSVPAHDEYDSSPGSRTIAMGSGVRTTTFTITAKDDNTFEGNRTVDVGVTITYTGLPAIPDPTPAQLTIEEDDLEPPARVTGVMLAPAVDGLNVTWNAAERADGYKVQWRSGANYDPTGTNPAVAGQTTPTTPGTAQTPHLVSGLTPGTAYTVQVIATRTGADDAPASAEATGTPRAQTPGRPGNVAASAASADGAQAGEIVVTWTAVTDADGYLVQWKSGSQAYASIRQVTVAGGATETATLPGLTAGTEYTVRVIATREHAENGPPSAESTATPRAPSPGQVTGVMVTAPGIAQLLVTWDAVANADGYKVQWHSGGSYNPAETDPAVAGETAVTGTRHTLENLEPGTLYTVRVIATRDNADDGLPSLESQGSPSSGPPPGRVGGVRLTAQIGGLLVQWNPVSDAGGYKVQWKSGTEDYDPANVDPAVAGEAAVIGSGATAYTIQDLMAGTPYTVRVIATRIGAEDGPPSVEQRGTPQGLGQVRNVRVAQGVQALMVSWTAVTGAEGYKVQWKSGAQEYDPATREEAVPGGNTTTHTIRNLTAGTEHAVRVIATRNGAEDAEPSAERPGTPGEVGQVLNVRVAPGIGSLRVSWDAVADATGYRVQWKSGEADYDPTSTAPAVAGEAAVSGGDATAHTIRGLRVGTEYTLRVIATLSGEQPMDGPPSLEHTGTPRASPPPPPPVSAAIVATSPDPLSEENLDGATLTVDLSGTAWVEAPDAAAFRFSLPGVSMAPEGLSRESDTRAVLTLAFSGEIEADAELSVTVGAAAHTGRGDLVTNAVPVAETPASAAIVATDPDPLTAEALRAGTAALTLELTGTAWVEAPEAAAFRFSLPGVSVAPEGLSRESDTRAVLTLTFSGEIEADAELSVTVGADVHEGEEDLVTNAVPVVAMVETASAAIVATDPDPLTAEALRAGTAALTLELTGTAWVETPDAAAFRFSLPGVSVAPEGLSRESDTRAVLTLSLSGELEADTELSVTVGADAHEGEEDLVTNAVPVVAGAETASAAIVATDPDPLREENLDGARLTVALEGSAWVAAPSTDDVTVSGVPGATVAAVAPDADDPARAVVTLAHDGTDFDVDAELSLTVGAGAHEGEDDLVTNAVPVVARVETVTARIAASDPDPLNEENLDGARLTVVLEGSAWVAAPATGEVTVSGVPGATVAAVARDASDPARAVVALAYDGTDFDADAELRVTVGAGAHAGEDELRTTNAVPVAATVEPATASIAATRPDPLTENALNAGTATLTVEVAETAWVAAPAPSAFAFSIPGLGVAPEGVRRASDTRVVLALSLSGDIERRTELRVTVGAAAHTRTGDIVTANTVPVIPAVDASLGRVATEWLSLFGRTVASYVMDAIGERLARDGASGSQASVGGQSLAFAGAIPIALPLQAGPGAADSATPYVLDAAQGAAGAPGLGGAGAADRVVAGRELLTTSAFHLSTASEGEAAEDELSVWGGAQATRVDDESGGLSLEGDVVTATVGADYRRGRMVAGVALSHSQGDGDFEALAEAEAAEDGGKMDASLGAVHPYVSFRADERSTLWATLGYGQGAMRLLPRDGEAVEADIEMRMAAAGGRRVLLTPEEADGAELAVKAETFVVGMKSEAAADLEAVSVQEHAIRLTLEGGYEYTLDNGARLRPSFELGLRHDAGDADTGTGLELGGGLSYADPATGVRVQADARALLAHQGERDEWGAGGAFHFDLGSDRRGFILSLSPSYGEADGGAERLWERGFAEAAGTADEASSPLLRFEAEAGYGVPVAGGRALFTPRAGFELSGSESRRYRLRLDFEQDDPALGIGLEGFRLEREGEDPDHGIGVRARMRW